MVAKVNEQAPSPNQVVAAVDGMRRESSAQRLANLANEKFTRPVPKTDDAVLDRKHKMLDCMWLAMLVLAAFKFGNPKEMIKTFLKGLREFPMHYTPVFDWKKDPMNKYVAISTMMTGWYFLLKTYWLERNVVHTAHKKYKAHNNKLAVAMHGMGSSAEITLGCLACCYPKRIILTKMSLALAINNVISGFILTPGVFGIKHLTVPGFYLFGVLRLVEILRTLIYDWTNYPQAWILLQVGTVVRLLGFFVLPFSSIDGARGDLFTEPAIYSFNILLSGYLTAAFVYPPKHVLSSLLLYVAWWNKQPPRISMKKRPMVENADQAPDTK